MGWASNHPFRIMRLAAVLIESSPDSRAAQQLFRPAVPLDGLQQPGPAVGCRVRFFRPLTVAASVRAWATIAIAR